jgi:hypothetical protein
MDRVTINGDGLLSLLNHETHSTHSAEGGHQSFPAKKASGLIVYRQPALGVFDRRGAIL